MNFFALEKLIPELAEIAVHHKFITQFQIFPVRIKAWSVVSEVLYICLGGNPPLRYVPKTETGGATYIKFIRKSNDKKGLEGQKETMKVYDFMLDHVGVFISRAFLMLLFFGSRVGVDYKSVDKILCRIRYSHIFHDYKIIDGILIYIIFSVTEFRFSFQNHIFLKLQCSNHQPIKPCVFLMV
ncbi:hypothetical protein F8388_014100 [Cannabis sativa]|uniref:Uncharacterized protein n=1 Tax=Cannabis sativa TaxID=3483 RepID=A0A7J6GML4_CANSA|nr:hypothetical protein F8388_014100 [Cannabis sativa]